MAQTMTCTRCFSPTPSEPDTAGLDVAAVILLCENWLCDTCLDQVEAERAATGEG